MKKITTFLAHVAIFIGLIIINRVMVLPIWVSYTLDRHPSMILQIMLTVVLIVLGIGTIWFLNWYYRRQLKIHNPNGFETEQESALDRKRTWITVIVLTILVVTVKFFLDQQIEANNNTVATESVFTIYRLPMFFALTLFGPIGEELTSRGLFFSLFVNSNSRSGVATGWLCSAITFALMHGASFSWSTLLYLCLGLILGMIYIFTRKVKYGIAMHIGLNLAASMFSLL